MGAQELSLGAGGNKVRSPPEKYGDKIAVLGFDNLIWTGKMNVPSFSD